MIKKLLLFNALVATTMTFAQWTQDFEGAVTPVFVSRGAPTTSGAVVSNPVTTGINTSTNALQITLTSGVPYFKWLGLNNPGGTYNAINGKFIKFKFMSANQTNVTIQLEPWFDGTVYTTIPVKTFTGLALNTWYEVEFDYSNLGYTTGYCTRLDLKFNVPASGNYNGDVFYIDDMKQQTSTALSTKSIEVNTVGVYPNPTSEILTINTTENFKLVTIIDILGKTVKTLKDTKVLNVSDLVNGVYFLKTDTGLQAKFLKK